MPWLSARQLDDWLLWLRRYYPFPDRMDPLWGALLAMTHNQWCEKADAMSPEDFMPYRDKYAEEMTADDLRRKLGLSARPAKEG